MDLGNRTLNGILQTISAENDLVGYNTYRNRKGRIVVKISFEEPSTFDQKEGSQVGFDTNRISFKKMSETQCRRNFNRTKKFRKDQSSATDSIEAPRNSDEIIHSTPVPNVLEASQCISDPCLPESPVTHVTSDPDLSCEEPFHDVCDSLISDTPEKPGSINTHEISVDPIKIAIEPKIPKAHPRKSRVYDSDKFDSPQEAADEPCDKKNCSFGPTPDQVDPSVVWSEHDKDKHEYIIKKCPHCDLQVCMLCMKYRGRHKKYFVKPPPWD